MKISALRLFNVKRFAGRGVAIAGIGDGVNVLCAANEFGKSTSFEALHALFFQSHSSVSADVRNLRPYSGGNPLVEADISTGQSSVRITKQYFGSRFARVTDLATGRLLAQADEAENYIASLIKGGTAGPAGLLWVRQGITGIEKRSRSEEEGEKQVRASLLESVQGEVEAVTGGRRMAEIMQTVADELDKLVTKRGPKAGGRYAIALEERERLATEELKLAGQVANLHEALDKREKVTKRLVELENPDQKKERRQAIETAQAGSDAARAHHEQLKTMEAELKLARERRDTARRELDVFRSALNRDRELSAKLHHTRQYRDEAANRRKSAIARIAKARMDTEAAEAQEQKARKLLTRLEIGWKAREAAERLSEMKDRLAKAEAARHALEEGEARLALQNIQPTAVEELQSLELEIAKLRAAKEATRPSVAISYESPAVACILMDGSPLEDKEERSYHDQAELSVPGIGRISLRSNQPAITEDREPKMEARRRALLASMAVEDLPQARERQGLARQLEGELREYRARLSLHAPDGLPKLRADVLALDAADASALEIKEDPSQVRSAFAEAEQLLVQTRQILREVEPTRASADDALMAAETALASQNAEHVQFEGILGPSEQRTERETHLAQRLADLDRALAEIETSALRQRAVSLDLEAVEARLKRAISVEAAAEREIHSLREAIAGLNAEIRARSDEAVEEKWRETTEALTVANARVRGFEKEVAVLRRLSSALDTARSDARDLYLKPVMSELKPLLGLLFSDVSITFDDKTLLPQTIQRNGQEEDIDRLSGGMREQLSVLTRLAFARLLARNGRSAPVILDDALVYSDDDRIERMFDALHRQSNAQQIIVFSCRQRAFQRLGGNVLQMTDWQP